MFSSSIFTVHGVTREQKKIVDCSNFPEGNRFAPFDNDLPVWVRDTSKPLPTHTNSYTRTKKPYSNAGGMFFPFCSTPLSPRSTPAAVRHFSFCHWQPSDYWMNPTGGAWHLDWLGSWYTCSEAISIQPKQAGRAFTAKASKVANLFAEIKNDFSFYSGFIINFFPFRRPPSGPRWGCRSVNVVFIFSSAVLSGCGFAICFGVKSFGLCDLPPGPFSENAA